MPFASTRSISRFPLASGGLPTFFFLGSASRVICSTDCFCRKRMKARRLIPTHRCCVMWYPASRDMGTSALLLSSCSRR